MGERHWTPFEIELLLHCYASTSIHPAVDSIAYATAMRRFQHEGLIDRIDYAAVTPKGKALVAMWCGTPIPVAIYVDPRLSPKEPQ